MEMMIESIQPYQWYFPALVIASMVISDLASRFNIRLMAVDFIVFVAFIVGASGSILALLIHFGAIFSGASNC